MWLDVLSPSIEGLGKRLLAAKGQGWFVRCLIESDPILVAETTGSRRLGSDVRRLSQMTALDCPTALHQFTRDVSLTRKRRTEEIPDVSCAQGLERQCIYL
jgi:hypothetical protein